MSNFIENQNRFQTRTIFTFHKNHWFSEQNLITQKKRSQYLLIMRNNNFTSLSFTLSVIDYEGKEDEEEEKKLPKLAKKR